MGHERARRPEGPDPVGLPTHLRLIAPVGAGSSATVWKARDTKRGRDVAVKLIDTGGRVRPDRLDAAGERLEREVRALARLQDLPGVVAVHECGLTRTGTAWIVTELVAGGSLADRLRDEPPDPVAAVDLGAQLAETLAVVHDRGIAHGDLTPSNVLLDGRGRPRLVDLGLAWLDGNAGTAGCTPAYSPPERLRGAPASPAADMWSLAATLYHAGVGRPPETSGRPDAPLDLPPAVPEELALVLRDCLSDRPRLRPAAREVADRLGSDLGRVLEAAPRAGRRRWWRRDRPPGRRGDAG